jgi:predicted ATPase
MLLAFPGATVLSLDGGSVATVDYRDTDHYRLTRDFLEAPDRFFRHLFDEPDSDSREAE